MAARRRSEDQGAGGLEDRGAPQRRRRKIAATKNGALTAIRTNR
jgi:hypothetical protein